MLADLVHRLRALFSRTAVERELDEELRFHFDRQVEEYRHLGLDDEEAVRRARLAFGGIDQIKEEYRDALGVRLLDDLLRDLRVGVRALAAVPAVTTVVILSLALAIGANTAFFSILNSLALRALPVRDPARLVHVTDSVRRDTGETRVRAWSYPVWLQIRQRTDLFEAATAWSFTRFNLASGGETRYVEGLWVDGGFFEAFGVPAILGRTLTPRDDRRGGGPDGPVAVIAYGYWQRQFGGAPDVIGRTVRLDTVPFTIIGVTAPEFFGPEVGRTFDFIVPVTTEALVRRSESNLDSAASNFLTIIARLRPEQPLEGAIAELRRVQPGIREATIGAWSRDVVERYLSSPFTLIPASTGFSNLRSTYQRPLLAIAGVALLVLLIGCVNVANLLLARAIARRHEFGIRLALGASRWRLVRQFVTETVLLSAAGATCGVLIASYGSRFLVQQLSTPGNTVFLDLAIDGRVLAFTIVLAVVTTIVFGVGPVLQISDVEPADPLNDASRGFTGTRGGLMTWLVTAQVALSIVLVVAAGLFGRSFLAISNRDLGLDPARILVVYLNSEGADVEPGGRVPLYDRVRHAVRAVPGVSNAAVSHLTPVGGGGFTPPVEIAGGELVAADRDVFGNIISPGWFDTFGVRMIAGRGFTDHDGPGAAVVAVVNETFARRYFGNSNPFERTITVYPHTPRALSAQIVGVVADAIYSSPREAVPPTWYMPMAQFPVRDFAAVRLSVQAQTHTPASLSRAITAAIGGVSPELTLTFRVLRDQIHAALTRERLMAQVAGGFGLLALLLAGLGLYGVAAYTISSRQMEMAIRLALGGQPARVMSTVMGRLLLFVAVGITLGAGLSLWLSQVIASLLYAVRPQDPRTLAGAMIVLASVAALAGWLPARHGTRIDPASVLRKS